MSKVTFSKEEAIQFGKTGFTNKETELIQKKIELADRIVGSNHNPYALYSDPNSLKITELRNDINKLEQNNDNQN